MIHATTSTACVATLALLSMMMRAPAVGQDTDKGVRELQGTRKLVAHITSESTYDVLQ